MLKERPLTRIRKAEHVKLSELARLTGVSRPVLAKYVQFDLLPYVRPEGKARKYYRLDDVRRVLKAIEPLRAKEIPVKHLRAELDGLKWYKELRARDAV